MMAEESLDAADPFDPADIQQATVAGQTAIDNAIQTQQAALRSRREAYVRVFRGSALSGDCNIVLADLKRFCRGDRTPWDPDARIHALLTGRSEVFTRIQQHMTMAFDELWELYSGGVDSE